MEPYTLSTVQTLLADVFPHIRPSGMEPDKAYFRARHGLLATALKAVRHPDLQAPSNSPKIIGKVIQATKVHGLDATEREMMASIRLGVLQKTQPWQRSGDGIGHHLLPLCLMVGDAAAVKYLLTSPNAPTPTEVTARLIPKPPNSNITFGLLPEDAQSLTPAAHCLLSMPTNETALTHTEALVAMARFGVDMAAPLTDLGHHAWDFIACGQTMMALAQAGLDWNHVDEQGHSRLAQVFSARLPTDRIVGMIQATQALHEEGRLPQLKQVWPELVGMFGRRLSNTWTSSERDVVDIVEAISQLSAVTGLPLGNHNGRNPTLVGSWAKQLLQIDPHEGPGGRTVRLENYPAIDKLSNVRAIPKRLGMTEEGVPDGVWVAMVLVHHDDYGKGKTFSRAALNELTGAHPIEDVMAGFAKALSQLGPNKHTWKSLVRLRSALPNRFWEQQVRALTAKTVEMFDALEPESTQGNWRVSSEFSEFVNVASELFKPLAQGEKSSCSDEEILYAARMSLWAGWTNKLAQSGFERWATHHSCLDTAGLMLTMDALARHDVSIGNSPGSQALFRGLVLHNNLSEAAQTSRKTPRF